MATKKSTSASPVKAQEKLKEQAETTAAQDRVSPIAVRIEKLFTDESKKLRAIASCNIGHFAVHGIRVFENEKGLFVNMPSVSYKDAQGNTQYDDVFHPVTKEGREQLVNSVIDAYKQALEQAQNQSPTHNENAGQTMQQM